MKTIINEITIDLGQVIHTLLKKDTACAYCGKEIKKKKSPLFVSGYGVIHDECYRNLVREHAAIQV